MAENTIKIEVASVKVMRSHDYCHFVVCLTTSEATGPNAVDELRKTAARLADKAVEQYKVAKNNAEQRIYDKRRLDNLINDVDDILKTPVDARTPEDMAKVKALNDHRHRARAVYDYEDDFSEEEDIWDDD